LSGRGSLPPAPIWAYGQLESCGSCYLQGSPDRASATSRSSPNAGTCLPGESGSRPGPRGRVAPGPDVVIEQNADESRRCRGPAYGDDMTRTSGANTQCILVRTPYGSLRNASQPRRCRPVTARRPDGPRRDAPVGPCARLPRRTAGRLDTGRREPGKRHGLPGSRHSLPGGQVWLSGGRGPLADGGSVVGGGYRRADRLATRPVSRGHGSSGTALLPGPPESSPPTGVSVWVSVHQPLPARTVAVWLDSASDLSSINALGRTAWTLSTSLRIWRLGVRVPRGALQKPSTSRYSSPTHSVSPKA
jgi:hypothetical protein